MISLLRRNSPPALLILLFFMALAEYRQSKFEEAGQVLKNAIASGIVDSDLHYLLAECLIRIDGTDSATVLAELDRAIQLNPNSVSARVLRGERLLASGRPQDAIIDLKIARELDRTRSFSEMQGMRRICWHAPMLPSVSENRQRCFSRS